MTRYLLFACSLLLQLCTFQVRAQVPVSDGGVPDLRRQQQEIDKQRDSLVTDSITYTAKYIRYTNAQMLREGTQTRMIDTTHYNIQNYSPLYQPYRPTIGLGNNGLAYRELLFSPSRRIGFDPGFHALDVYMLRQDSIRFYRARSPYTELYYVNGRKEEQTFRVTHSQNVKPNLNIGANYYRIGAEGFYVNQNADHLNAALFTWYESKNNRYNLFADALFNTIKAGENGGPTNYSFFDDDEILNRVAVPVHLRNTGRDKPQQTWRQTQLFLKQMYYIGRMDSLQTADSSLRVLPTQRVSHTITMTWDQFRFFRNEDDTNGIFPVLPSGAFTQTIDSTRVRNLRNEFTYSFYLRGKAVSFFKNEVKLDLGLQNDIYHYEQMGYERNFSNSTLIAGIGYRFSDRVSLEGDLNQIVQGRNFGDYLYEARAHFLLSNSIGKVILGAYTQNQSPAEIFERVNYQSHSWIRNFDKTKVNNLSFQYENNPVGLIARAEYYLTNNYLYFRETDVSRQIEPVQIAANMNMLKLSIAKKWIFGKFHLENYVVYQKTDFQDVLRTPEVYTYNSFYFNNRFFKVLHTHIGFDLRFNTPFQAPDYALNVSQFYNDSKPLTYSSYPIADLWIRATLKRTNLFLKYDYANQGLFSKGYYTVRNYPMPDSLLKFGVNWKFYN